MPRLEDDPDLENSWTARQLDRATRWYDGFVSFALRDNVLEVAVGLILAAAFTAVANSLVSDIILPIISLLPFIDRNIEEKFLVLRAGPHYDDHSARGYNTVQKALDDGAIVWAWGSFVDKVVRFFIIAISLFLIANIYSWASHDQIVKQTIKCKYCRKYISEKAKRCVNCTSWQDGREDR